MTYTEGSAPEEADETAKAPVSSTGVVAKPKAVSSEIGGQVDTQPITWPPAGSLSPEDWSESLFLKGQTNWYWCLSLRVKTQPPHVLILHLPLRITDVRHPSRRELFLCAAATATKHRSYTYQLWDAEANEWELWHSLKRFGGVGGARVPADVQTRVGDWVAERVAEPLTGRGYKADPMVVDDEADDTEIVKSEGSPKGRSAVEQESTPRATPKPAPKGKAPAKVTAPPAKVTAPPATPDPIPFPMEETVRGISDGVMRTLEGNVQFTLRDILPAAVREAMKTESSTRATREMQKLQNELAVAKSQAKAAEKRAQDLWDALEDSKRQKTEVEGELKLMREKWEEEKVRSSKYLTILEKQK